METTKKYYAIVEFIVTADNRDIPDDIECDIENLMEQNQLAVWCNDIDISYSRVVEVEEETLPRWKHIIEFEEHEYVALREFIKGCKNKVEDQNLQDAFNRIVG